MSEEKKLRPPYASSGQADEIIELLRKVTPKKIDSSFITDYKITTSPNAFRIIDLVRWLKITDFNGDIDEEKIGKLRLVGEDRDVFVAGLIRESYKDLFERVDLNTAKKEDVVNFFISHYGLSNATARVATRLFLHLCTKYGISLSESLRKGHVFISKRKVRKEKRAKSPKGDYEKEMDEKQDMDAVIISIHGKISTKLEARTGEQLDDILKKQLPKVFDALKLFLPEKEETKE